MSYKTTDHTTGQGSNCSQKAMGEMVSQNEREIDVLARTIWGEARGEGQRGMLAVACVVLNRHKISNKHDDYWWGTSIADICQHPFQFSVWNDDDPNLNKVKKVDRENDLFLSALSIARRAVYGEIKDITNGATHYHAAGITPIWSHKEKPVETIGRHIFYKLEED